MKKFDILCTGELAIDEMGLTDKMVEGTAVLTQLNFMKLTFGGRGPNFAVAASAFGAHVSLVCAFGNDERDGPYRRYLKNKGIDLSGAFQSRVYPTAKGFYFIEGRKEVGFFYAGPLVQEPGKYLKKAEGFIGRFECEALYCGSNFIDINRVYLKKVKARMKVFSPAQNLHHYSKSVLEECMSNSNALFINHHDISIVEEMFGRSIGRVVDGFGINILITTMGRKGSKITIDGKSTVVSACKPRKVVDPTGAGDAFAGAFMANYLKTDDPVYSARLASSTASFIVEEIGTLTGMPTMAKAMSRARKNYGRL